MTWKVEGFFFLYDYEIQMEDYEFCLLPVFGLDTSSFVDTEMV